MPFRSVKFGDSIINMKSVLTAQSPWWYQLKTASFRVGTCHAAAFFSFFPLFSFQGKSFPWPRYHHAPVPCSSPRAWLPWAAGKYLAFHSRCPICAHRSWPSVCQKWAMGSEHNISSWHHACMASVAWAAPSRKPCGDPALLVQRLWAGTADRLMNFTVRPQFINIIFLFQSVFQVFIPWMLQVKSWIMHEVSGVKSYLHAKVMPAYPEVKSVQTPSVRTLLN